MKKNLSIIMMAIFLSTSGAALAANYDAQVKEELYDGFLRAMFSSMHYSLARQQFSESSINSYLAALNQRIDRRQLETATWPCLSAMEFGELTTQGHKCFTSWATDLMRSNVDLTKLLK